MTDWIRSIFNTLAAPIRNLISELAKRVGSVWSVITGFLAVVRSRWQTLRTETANWVQNQIRHAAAIAATLKWLATVYIPRKISQEAASIRTWTANLIDRAINGAKALIADVKTWAATELGHLLNALNAFKTWATGLLGTLVDTVNRMAHLVFGVLSTPERIAAWIVAPMFSALLHYAMANIERVGIALYSRRRQIYAGLTHVIEDILGAIL